MALKEGKKLVNLKASVADNIGIPKFPTTNIAAEIAKPLSEIADTFRKTAEADAKVEWQYNFNKTSRDHYLDLKEKFKFDPDGMRNAIDSYSKTTLANTPRVYKSVAENLLSQKNLANMSYATTNYENQKTNNLLTGWEETKSQTITDTGGMLETIIASDNLSAMDINSHIGNVVFKNLNHNYGTAEETLVGTNRYKGTQLAKDLNNDIIEIEALRIFSLMRKLGDVEGIKLFTNYAAGQDNFMVTPDDVNNPIFQKYSNDIRNPLIRSKIISKVKSLYDDHRGAKINGLKNADVKYNLDREQDAGSLLDVHNFRDGVGNASNWVITNMPNISQSQFGKAVEIVDKNIKVQTLVSKAINNGEIIDNFESNEQMELFQTAILRRYGINDTNLTDVENPQLATVMEVFKNQNMEPTAIIKKLEGNYNVNFNSQGMVEKFEKNLALYNYIKSNDMFPYVPIENENIYIKANEFGILGGNESREVKAETLNKIVGDKNFDKDLEKISKHIDDNVDVAVSNMRWTINMQDINTDTWWLKKTLFPKGKNKFAHMFIPESTSLWYYGTKMAPQVQQVWLENTKRQLALMYGGKDIDINTNEGKVMFYKASMQALNSMNRQGYSATRLNGTGEITMIKHGFEKEVGFTGQGLDSALIAQANWLKNNLTPKEQEERFGFVAITPDGKKTKPVDIYELMKTEIDNGKKNLIIEPTGTFNKNGKPNYHVKLIHENKIINLTQGDNYFDPTGLGSNKLASNQLPGSRAELMNTLAEKKFNLFMEKYGEYIDGDNAVEGWIRKFLFATTKTFIEASDYRFYPDFPGVKDVPAEVKPFGFIFKVLGKDLNVEDYYDQGAKINNEINDIVSYDKQIVGNMKISPKDKLIESAFPPHKTSYTDQNIQLGFRQHVYNNYQNKSLPLTFRTNNYMAVMKTDQTWEGQMTDIDTGNQAAIFASPVDSIRAGVRVMLNNSSLSLTDTTKRYGDTPTIEEILTSYAENTSIYLDSLEEKTNFTRDTQINFFDSNQMMKLIKFMIEHEMGSEAFNKYYPPENQRLLDAWILEGYNRGINSYGGKLGKMN
jgi:hypothetical protein